MKRTLFLFSALLSAAALLAADSSPKDDVTAAAKALGAKANYSWKTTVVVPESAQFRPGPTEGQTEKDGCTYLKLSMRDNTVEAVIKGDKAAINGQDGWQSLADLDNAQGPGRFVGGMVRNFKAPAAQAAEIAAGTKELKKDGDAIAGELTEEGAKPLLSFRGRGAGGDGPSVSSAKGSVKFWIKDGVLTKYEYHVTGKVSFNGNDRDVDRTTTVEVKDVGTTKITVPEDAKKKLS